jgi:hypothetical protein
VSIGFRAELAENGAIVILRILYALWRAALDGDSVVTETIQ